MQKSIVVVSFSAFVALAACESSIPDSGVGFNDYNSNNQQALQGSPIQSGVISDESTSAIGISAAIEEAVNQTPALVNGTDLDPNRARANSIAGVQSTSSISDEQDFNAVSGRETIQSDAERLARNRAQYVEIVPEALPTREGSSSGTSIISFALQTTNSVGQPIYNRSGNTSAAKFQKACAKFRSSDQAQQAFLDGGGPSKDRKGIDPDGDGFACFWDPTPFRAARGG